MTEALEFGQVESSQIHQGSCDEQLNFEINFGIVHVSEMIQIRGAFVVVHLNGLKPVCRTREQRPGNCNETRTHALSRRENALSKANPTVPEQQSVEAHGTITVGRTDSELSCMHDIEGLSSPEKTTTPS